MNKNQKKQNKTKPKKTAIGAMLAKQLAEKQRKQEELERKLQEEEQRQLEEEEKARIKHLEEMKQKKAEEKLQKKQIKAQVEKQKVDRNETLSRYGININQLPKQVIRPHNKRRKPKQKNQQLTEETIKVDDNVCDDWENDFDTNNNIETLDEVEPSNDIETSDDIETSNDEVDVKERMKAPICCILGNVDVGKTTFIDRIGSTKVQQNEAGGITQTLSTVLIPFKENPFKIPGVILIDTPGHDSFYNLRSFGASLCNLVILMIDILEGVKEQTIKSIELIKSSKIPYFIVANKLDRINMWESNHKIPVSKNLAKQKPEAMAHFEDLMSNIILQFAENGLNTELSFRNSDPRKYASIFPVSAHTKEGINEMFKGQMDLITKYLRKDIIWNDNFKGIATDTTMEKGFGRCTNILLYDGKVSKKDSVVLTTLNGPVAKQISKLGIVEDGKFKAVDEAYATRTVKFAVKGDESIKPIVGSPIYYLPHTLSKTEYNMHLDMYSKNVIEYIKSKEDELNKCMSTTGVLVCSSTFGGLTAITEYLKNKNVPFIDAKIGIVKTQDIHRILNFNKTLEDQVYNIIVCFNANLDARASVEVEKCKNISVIGDDIIYRVFEKLDETIKQNNIKLLEEYEKSISHPVIMKLMDDSIYRRKKPIVVGVEILDGILKKGTIIQCLKKTVNKYNSSEDLVLVGTITNIQNTEEKKIDEATVGDIVTIEIVNNDDPKLVGRDFGPHDKNDICTTFFWSKMTEESYYMMKQHFYEDAKPQWKSAFHELSSIYGFEN